VERDDIAGSSTETLARPEHWLNRTVLGVGITSALGDMAHETVTVILPGFLTTLQIPAAALGTIEGVADATSSFVKLASGYLSDRLGRRKPLVLLGYAAVPVGQVCLALASSLWLILVGRTIGWFGRGVRGPLRDALLAEAITPSTRGRAFGFHRAADTFGAIVGPLIGVGMLALLHNRIDGSASAPYRWVIWFSVVPGILSILSFALLVDERRRPANAALRFWASLRGFPKRFRRYLAGVGLFGIGDYAPTLLILAATTQLSTGRSLASAAQLAGLLYVLRNTVQAVASLPLGALADRLGHQRVLVWGYALGVVVTSSVVMSFLFSLTSIAVWALIFAGAGLVFATQDALEATLTAEMIAEPVRGTAFGLLGSVNGVGDLISSVAVGTLWTVFAPEVGFGAAALAMAGGTILLARTTRT
jgi:MFS family permease